MLNGVSGNESAVREFIETQIKDYCRIETDNAGNLIAFKKGARTPEKRVMFAAHMDEVGFIVTSVTDDGYIKIAPVGGIDARVMLEQEYCSKMESEASYRLCRFTCSKGTNVKKFLISAIWRSISAPAAGKRRSRRYNRGWRLRLTAHMRSLDSL